MRVPGGLIRMLGLCALAGVLLAGLLSPVAIGAGLLSNQVSDSVDAMSANLADTQVPLVTTITDKNGTPIAQIFDQYRLPVSFDQISPAMKAAIIAVEDKRFYQNTGLDMKGALRAAINDTSGGSTQGASTITQQFVKNYLVNVVDRNNPAARDADQAQTLARKLREAKMAMQLEQTMSKNNILTGYLNVVAFGNTGKGPFGVGAAAKAYFGTTADKLTVAQSALLAGMVNNPNLYNPYAHPQSALNRRNDVINKMVLNNALSPADAKAAQAEPLGVLPGTGPQIPSSTCYGAAPDAGFFCDYAISYLESAGFTQEQITTGGYTIKTTMDPNISNIAKNVVDQRVPTTIDGIANTFAIIQPGNTSHNVLAMVSNRNFGTDANQGEISTNQLTDVSDEFGGGSTYKLFTTAAAMEMGQVGLNTDMPNPKSTCFPFPITNRYTHCYPVSNDDATNPDPISLTNALQISPNTAFVGLEEKIGMQPTLNMAYRLGMRQTMNSNQHGGTPVTDPNNPRSKDPTWNKPQIQAYINTPAFTLGESPLSPLEHANVGATLDSGGVWCPANPIVSVTDRYGKNVPFQQEPCEQIIPQAEAQSMLNGMSHDTEPGGTSGAAAAAAGWTRPTSAKTGTSQTSESVGFLGIVDGFAASSLVFADGSHPNQICPTSPPHLGNDCGNGAFGGTLAAPTFFDAFNQILAGVTDTPVPPADPAYMDANNHGPIVPFVVGVPGDQAVNQLKSAGYQVVTKGFNSNSPRGTVVAQTPQSNVPTGTVITLWISTGVLPAPPNAQAPASTAPGSTTGG